MCAHDRGLRRVDPAVADALDAELRRQQRTLEMIASENFAPVAVLEAQGSVATNKYAEGYPGRRYYGGCEFVDVIESLAIERATTLFGARFANVQPHSGAQANAAAFYALLEHGDTVLGLDLAHGGHLTHGMRLNFSGRNYNAISYAVDQSGWVDMAQVEQLALLHRPKMIIAGWSAYPRQLDFAQFRRIADQVGAYLMVDMAHFAGLVAARLHPDPVHFADVVTSTTHKTLGGPRGGFVLTNDEGIAKRINAAVFPGLQGGPLQHIIAAKAVAFLLASSADFAERQRRTLEGAKILAARMFQVDLVEANIEVATNGTDVHLVLLNLARSAITGKEAEDRLHAIGITVNRNAVPHDPRPPMIASGLRIGTSALATRGFAVDAFADVADVIALCLTSDPSTEFSAKLRRRVTALADQHPLYPALAS